MQLKKIVVAVMAVCSLMSVSTLRIHPEEAGSVRAEEAPAPSYARPEDVLNKPPAQLTDADLSSYLDLALAEKITVQQAEVFMGSLSADQQARLMNIIDARTPPRTYSPEELEQGARNDEALRQQNSVAHPTGGCDPMASQPGLC